ncbi:hypothetical protein CLAIMM_07039 isoform 1 [Cladophialophora immunda]|nr:hypothetical protein CLAIMM_07039 isoform 1 [Cladophialophora immunda]
MGGDGGSSWGNGGNSGMDQGGQYGSGGSGGQGGSWGGGNSYNNQYTSTWGAAPTTVVQAQSCPPQSCPPPMTSTMTETTTVTAVSPCMGSTVTAYVTQWMNAPPGCWCGAGSPPPMASGWEWGGMGAAAVFTSSNPSFTPGLSSIPASEAVQTGVTVAGAPPAAAPTAAVSPGGFFGESSSKCQHSCGIRDHAADIPSRLCDDDICLLKQGRLLSQKLRARRPVQAHRQQQHLLQPHPPPPPHQNPCLRLHHHQRQQRQPYLQVNPPHLRWPPQRQAAGFRPAHSTLSTLQPLRSRTPIR